MKKAEHIDYDCDYTDIYYSMVIDGWILVKTMAFARVGCYSKIVEWTQKNAKKPHWKYEINGD